MLSSTVSETYAPTGQLQQKLHSNHLCTTEECPRYTTWPPTGVSARHEASLLFQE
jgi:hypothetical protein